MTKLEEIELRPVGVTEIVDVMQNRLFEEQLPTFLRLFCDSSKPLKSALARREHLLIFPLFVRRWGYSLVHSLQGVGGLDQAGAGGEQQQQQPPVTVGGLLFDKVIPFLLQSLSQGGPEAQEVVSRVYSEMWQTLTNDAQDL